MATLPRVASRVRLSFGTAQCDNFKTKLAPAAKIITPSDHINIFTLSGGMVLIDKKRVLNILFIALSSKD